MSTTAKHVEALMKIFTVSFLIAILHTAPYVFSELWDGMRGRWMTSRWWPSSAIVMGLLLAACEPTAHLPQSPSVANDRPRAATFMALLNRGARFEKGIGVDKDEARAAALYTEACDGGLPQGCAFLGELFEGGRGVDKDAERAAALYTKACVGGESQSCTHVGFMFEEGRGVGKDEARAATLFFKACDGGDALGCSKLGLMFEEGRGVGKNEARAMALDTNGCNGGVALACFHLGVLLEEGRGVGKDEARAATVYTKACDGGVARGCSHLCVFRSTRAAIPALPGHPFRSTWAPSERSDGSPPRRRGRLLEQGDAWMISPSLPWSSLRALSSS